MNGHVYTAASGLTVEQRRLEAIANNLANLSTHGYRALRLFSRVYRNAVADARGTAATANVAVAVGGAYEVPGPGPLHQTGRGLDVALEDGSFLVLETAGGRRYTRSGNLQVSPDGKLSDAQGNPLLGASGKPVGGLGPNASIATDGRVLEDGNEVARLRLVRDPAGVLAREGEGRLTAGGRDGRLEEIAETSLRPGWLEGSGTDVLAELVGMIEAQRAFESYQRVISLSMNDVNRKAVNELAG